MTLRVTLRRLSLTPAAGSGTRTAAITRFRLRDPLARNSSLESVYVHVHTPLARLRRLPVNW